jgi:hypothetical protein
MTSGWPPERDGRRRPDAPSGGSHRRSALRTPPHGIDLGNGGNGYPDEGGPGYPDGGQRGYWAGQPGFGSPRQPGEADAAQSGYRGTGQPGYPDGAQRGYPGGGQPGHLGGARPGRAGAGQPGYEGSAQPHYGGPPAGAPGGRRGRHGGTGQPGQRNPGPAGQGRGGPRNPAPGAGETPYYNMAYGAHGYDSPGRGPGDSGGGPVYSAPVADAQAPGRRGSRGTPDGQPGYGGPQNGNADSPRSRHGRPGQAGPQYAEPGSADAPRPTPGPAGSRNAGTTWSRHAGPGEPRYAGPGPADPRFAGPGHRGPGRGGPQHDAPGNGSPRPPGPGPGRGSGPQAAAAPRDTQPRRRRWARQDADAFPEWPDGDDADWLRGLRPGSAADAFPGRREPSEATDRRPAARPDTDAGPASPRPQDRAGDVPRPRRAPRDEASDASPQNRGSGDDAPRSRRARRDADGDAAFLRRQDGGGDASRPRRPRRDGDGDTTFLPRQDGGGDAPHSRRARRDADGDGAFLQRRGSDEDAPRPRRARRDGDGDTAFLGRQAGGDDAPRSHRTRRDVGRDDAYPPRQGPDPDTDRERGNHRDARRGDAYPPRPGTGTDPHREPGNRWNADGDTAYLSRRDGSRDSSRVRARTADDVFRMPASRQAGPAGAPFLASARDAHPGQAVDLAGSANVTGTATMSLPALADTAIVTGPHRRPEAVPDRGPRPGSRRAQTGDKASRLAGGSQVLARPSRRDYRPDVDDEPARRRSVLGLTRKTWLLSGVGVLVLVCVAVGAVFMLGRSRPSGPRHSFTIPTRLGAFTRSSKLTKQMNVGAIERNIIEQGSGQASHLVSSVYEAGSPVAGGTPAQVMLFIGGQLNGGSPATSVRTFTEHFKGAERTGAGSLGGDAACVGSQAAGTGGQTVCAWFDNNTFGELVSPNMPVSALASELRAIRPDVEHVVK